MACSSCQKAKERAEAAARARAEAEAQGIGYTPDRIASMRENAEPPAKGEEE